MTKFEIDQAPTKESVAFQGQVVMQQPQKEKTQKRKKSRGAFVSG
jgi:hypothetical protein